MRDDFSVSQKLALKNITEHVNAIRQICKKSDLIFVLAFSSTKDTSNQFIYPVALYGQFETAAQIRDLSNDLFNILTNDEALRNLHKSCI